jgi:hypothetical protein
VEEVKPENETETFKKVNVQFELARLILTADKNDEGLTMLQTAVDGGYDNVEAIEELAKDESLSKLQSDQVSGIASKLAAAKAGETVTEEGNGEQGTGNGEEAAGSETGAE